MNLSNLSPEEAQILRLLVQGYRTSEASKHLSLPFQVVAETTRRLKVAFGVDDVAKLGGDQKVRAFLEGK
jgi:DNA-binding NarL/FixJ family response regulator